MTKRLPIVAFLLLTYALLLGHDLLPHHHHEEPARPVTHHHDSGPDHHHDTNPSEPDRDWTSHVHVPGLALFDGTSSESVQAPVVADLTPGGQVRFRQIGPEQIQSWPPSRAKAPPGAYHHRPLRGPPFVPFFS